MKLNRTATEGFTLLEIAIVLVIIGILAGGAVPLMNVLTDRKVRTETLDYMDEAKAALISFAKINGRLPCADNNNDGVEDAGQYKGTLPFQTLGIRPSDAEGRHLGYTLNSNLGGNLQASCNTLQGSIAGQSPVIVDSAAASSVAAVLISGGPKDADGDGSVFDSINVGTFTGNNVTGTPNYIRNPPTGIFDDLVVYIDRLTLYSEMCGNPQLSVTNSTASNVFVYSVTSSADIGVITPGNTQSYGIISGSQIQINKTAGGGSVVTKSNPTTPIIVAGSGTTINVITY